MEDIVKIINGTNLDKKLVLDLTSIEPSLAGPKRPQDKILLKEVPIEFGKIDKNPNINKNL